MHFTKIKLAIATVLISVSSFNSSAKDFLNVSYDPTRELYENLNQEFGQYWKKSTGQVLNFKQSHGGSGRSVGREGCPAPASAG